MWYFRRFRSTSASGHVFFVKNGERHDKGLAFSTIIGPNTTVAVVPTTSQVIDFAISALTEDKQRVTVTGNVTVLLVPEIAAGNFDFTIDVRTGGDAGDWNEKLKTLIIDHAVRAVQQKARTFDVEDATLAQAEVEDAIITELSNDVIKNRGITVSSCSIRKIDPEKEVAEAIGAPERLALLTKGDDALHERRLAAAGNDRTVRQFESATKLQLEADRTALIEKTGENDKKAATHAAQATDERLRPYKDLEPGKLVGVALIQMAEHGVENITIGPELLGALKQQ